MIAMCKHKDVVTKAAEAYDKFVSRLLRIDYIDGLSQEEIETLVKIDPKRRPRYRHPLSEHLRDVGWSNIARLQTGDKFVYEGSSTQSIVEKFRDRERYVTIE